MRLVLGLDRTTVLRPWHDLAGLVDGVVALFAGGVGAVGVVSFREGPLHAFPEGHLDGFGGVEAGLDERGQFGHRRQGGRVRPAIRVTSRFRYRSTCGG